MRHCHVGLLCHVCGMQCMCCDGVIFNVSFVFSSFFWYMMIKKGFHNYSITTLTLHQKQTPLICIYSGKSILTLSLTQLVLVRDGD